MYENMVYHSPDQTLRGPFGATVDKVTGSFETGAVRGGKRPPPPGYRVPYDAGWHPSRPRPPPTGPSDCLSGKALKAQAAEWAAGGIIEPDAAEALCWLSDHFDKGESLQDVYVVMIGAGSAMGPFPKLMEMGATVVAIDIPGAWGKGGPRPASGVWRRLCDTAREARRHSPVLPALLLGRFVEPPCRREARRARSSSRSPSRSRSAPPTRSSMRPPAAT